MRVLVTGASGFVGPHTVAALASRGHDVVALRRRRDLPSAVLKNCAEVIAGDLRDPIVQQQAVHNVEAICHLAAYIPENFGNHHEAESCYRTNALGTLELASVAAKEGIKRFIYISTANMYGPSSSPATEADSVFPDKFASYYFVSKLAGEIHLVHACRQSATTAIALRIGSPYGPDEPKKKVVPTLIDLAARGKPLRVAHGGKPTYNFVFVKDVADCVASAVECGPPGIYNISSGEQTTLRELAQAVAATFDDREIEIEVDPWSRSSPTGFPAISIEKARQTWGFAPVALGEGLRRYRQTFITGG